MSINSRLVITIALSALCTISYAVPGIPELEDNASLAVEQAETIVYPSSMLLNGITSGEASVAISVDADGRLVDCLVTGYTDRAFADSTVAAIKNWKFTAARVHGRNTAARADVLVTFKNKMGVVQLSMSPEHIERLLMPFFQELYAYKVHALRDLDRIPTPIHVVQPAVPKGSVSPGQKHVVTVEFYIDEEGKVRMPAVDRASIDDIYAAAAVIAVEQWRFEPPMHKGRPALVLVQQDFNFVGK